MARNSKRGALLGLVLICTAALGCSDFQSYEIRPGVKVLVLRDHQKAWPVYASSLEAEFNLAAKDASEALEGNLSGKVKETVQPLYDKMNNMTAQLRNQVVALYDGYVLAVSAAGTAEGREKATDRFFSALERLGALVADVRQVRDRIAEARSNNSSRGWDDLKRAGDSLERKVQDVQKTAVSE